MSDNKRTDGSVIFAIVLIAVGAWLLMGRVFGDWFGPVREALRFVGNLGWPLALIGIGVLVLLAAQGRLGSLDFHGKRLYRSRRERMISGVLGGLADVIGVDPTIVRVAYVLFGLASGGAAIILYIIASIVIPEEPVTPPAQPVWPGDASGRETVQTPPPAPPVPPAPQPPTGSWAPAPPAAPEPPTAPQPPAAPQPPSAPEPPA